MLACVSRCAPTVAQAAQPRHLVVLDAGSTGTRVHVFQYAADTSSSYAALSLPEPKLKVQPGLSAFASDAAGAAASLQPLLQFAAQHVPASQVARTPVYLMATAGLRLLPAAAAEAILSECRSALLASDFLFESDWAQIISGTYEGLYAWVAANYAAGHLQVGHTHHTWGRVRPRLNVVAGAQAWDDTTTHCAPASRRRACCQRPSQALQQTHARTHTHTHRVWLPAALAAAAGCC